MGPGHLAIAFAAKPAAPKIPICALLIASEVPEILVFTYIALGVENAGASTMTAAEGIRITAPSTVYWSHGMLMCLVYTAIVAAITYAFTRDRRASLITGSLVFGHWLLDFLVHPADLPLFLAGSPKVGLGLWSSGPGLVIAGILDFGMFFAGLVYYLWWKGVFHTLRGWLRRKTEPAR